MIRKGEVGFRGTPAEAAALTQSILLPAGNPAAADDIPVDAGAPDGTGGAAPAPPGPAVT